MQSLRLPWRKQRAVSRWRGRPRLGVLDAPLHLLCSPLPSAGWLQMGWGGLTLELVPRSAQLTSLGCLSPSAGSDPARVPCRELGCLFPSPQPLLNAPEESLISGKQLGN